MYCENNKTKIALKKLTAILMAIVLLLCVAPLEGVAELDFSAFNLSASALAETGKCGNNVIWNFDSTTGTLTISGTGKMECYFDTDTIFSNNAEIKSVIIENGVTSIGSEAFNGCTGLKSVSIPNSVTSIGNSAFASCTNLESVTIPDNVTSIGSEAFWGCSSFKNVTIPDSVTSIGTEAFSNCQNLESITIGSGKKSIGAYAFMGCSNVKNVYISDLSSWCNISFYNWDSNPLCASSESALYLNGTLVTDLVIPSDVTAISDFAFRNCTSLQSVTIGSGVTSIGEEAFWGCTNIKNIYISDISAWCNISFSDSCSNPKYVSNGANLYFNGTLVTDLVIPSNVTAIPAYAFYEYDNLESVTIGDGVTSVGVRSFCSCKNLKSVTLGKGVTSVEKEVFKWCSNLEKITVLNNSLDISQLPTTAIIWCNKNSAAHAYCVKSDRSFVLIDGTDEDNKFSGNVGRFTWSLDKITGVLKISGIGDLPSFGDVGAPWNDNYQYVTTIEYEDGITTLMSDHSSHSNLKSVIIPESVTSIGESAFSGCSKLKSIILPDVVTSIGDYAFSGCASLKSVTIPDGVTRIEDSTFSNCTSLKSATIPDSVTSIGVAAFSGCTGLKSVTIPNSVTSMGNSAFASCTNLESVTIPDNVTSIGGCVFTSCTSLKSVTIPNSVTSIGDSAFYDCPALESITIPYSVKYICESALSGTLKEIYVYSTDCEFDKECGLNYTHTIYGFKGSTAEAFADKIAATFIDIETIHTHKDTNGDYKCDEVNCGYEYEKPAEPTTQPTTVPTTAEPTTTQPTTTAPTASTTKPSEESATVPSTEAPTTVHTHTEVTVKGREATCKETGLTDGKKCSECGEVISEQKEIAKTDHNVEYDSYYECNYCTYCDAIIIEKGESVTMRYGGSVNLSRVYGVCSDNAVVSVEGSVGGWSFTAAGFQYNYTVKLYAMKTGETSVEIIGTDGYVQYVIDEINVCVVEPEKKHKHTEVTVKAVEPTYTETGLTEGKKCSSCGEILEEQKTVSRKKLKKVTSLKVKSTKATSVKLSWKKVEGAESYKVYYSTNGKKWKSVKTTKTSVTVKKLTSATKYQFKVKAVAGKYEGSASSVVKKTTKVSAPTVKSVKSSKAKQAVVTWEKVNGADGYVIEYSTSKKFTKKTTKSVTVKKGKTVKTTLKKLKSRKKYYVRVKAYRTVNKKAVYGNYSSVKSVKVK